MGKLLLIKFNCNNFIKDYVNFNYKIPIKPEINFPVELKQSNKANPNTTA
jgi:hypothetical protein